jgi:hypothetical protein
MEIVRYRPGEAIRWLQTGAENQRKSAQNKGRSVVQATESKPFTQNLKTAASAILDFGKGAYTELVHRQAAASEYVLQDEHFDIVNGTSIKSIPYDRVRSIEWKGDKAVVTLDKGTLTIKPFAHIVAGRMKVPIGWVRNGTEVPYELIVDELAARCRVDVEETD